MQHPETIPEKIQAKLKNVGLWDVNPLNLFRITWKNEAKESGGGFQAVPNYVEIPSEPLRRALPHHRHGRQVVPHRLPQGGRLLRLPAPRAWSPASLTPPTITPCGPPPATTAAAAPSTPSSWPATSVAILPAEMSKERFDWLSKIAGQVIATPGCESNVKEIFDKTWELKQDPSMMIFNQFEEMGNPLWHYNVTGYALADLFEAVKTPRRQRLAGACFTSGSAGTMSAGDLLKERYPQHEARRWAKRSQCPTILDNGFGGHRIEGIGDKHIPWIHNVKNTDMAIAIDDEDSQRLLRLFNTAEGQKYLKEELKLWTTSSSRSSPGWASPALPTSCAASRWPSTMSSPSTTWSAPCSPTLPSCIRAASRSSTRCTAPTTSDEAALDHNLHMLGLKTDSMMELTYEDRKRIHNLKYYTWVEQQARDVKDLNALWYDTKGTWDAVHAQAKELDELINEFNEATGLLKAL